MKLLNLSPVSFRLIQLPVLFLVFFLSIMTSCKQTENEKVTEEKVTESKQLSTEEKEAIKKIISARIQEIVDGVRNTQIDSALKPYADIPEFLLVTPDGRITRYTEMVEEQRTFEKQVKKASFTTIKEEFLFLENDLVMCTWKGKNEFTLKTGEKFLVDPYVGSMLFRKSGNVWSIIYAHESTGTVVKQ